MDRLGAGLLAGVDDLFDQRQEHRIAHQNAVFSVIDDVDELLGEKARVDGVNNGAHTRDAIVGLKMPMVVPGQRRNAVGHSDPGRLQRLGQLFGTLVDLFVGVADHAFAGHNGYNFGTAVDVCTDLDQ